MPFPSSCALFFSTLTSMLSHSQMGAVSFVMPFVYTIFGLPTFLTREKPPGRTMKKSILPLLLCLAVSLGLLSFIKAGNRSAATVAAAVSTSVAGDSSASVDASSALSAGAMLYRQSGLQSMGLSEDAFQYAFKGFQHLVDQGILTEQVLTIIDFSQPSSKKRMYILDMATGAVLFNTYVAHGRNSGLDYAEKFSNRPESLQSSLGFYVTKGTYSGKHGLSLRLSGLENGWNSNAESRAVVVHGAEYIGSSRSDAAYMGRSWGCPAVPQAQAPKVINMIKNGTALFIYHPTQQYLNSSKLING
ncbi:MAG: murein L,D-transpeptidase catalytic domain family protein [Sphingobacteriales bacterium]|nr:MAG: murein L,D-transpeptidase catalytic domain family protein [Sphingobacteriales bacterium]